MIVEYLVVLVAFLLVGVVYMKFLRFVFILRWCISTHAVSWNCWIVFSGMANK